MLDDNISKKIKKNYLFMVTHVVSMIVMTIFHDDMFMFLRYCNNQHCHVHSEFIADTYWTGGPLKDIVYEEIQCETQANFRLFYSFFDN